MKKTTQTFLIILFLSISALITPIFGQYYYQQTGILPIAFYLISGTGFSIFAVCSIIMIWEK